MSEDKVLNVDTSLKEELDIKKKMREDLLIVLNKFSKILDYDELDIAKFLNTRKPQKYFILNVLKILFYSIFYILVCINGYLASRVPASSWYLINFLLTYLFFGFLSIGFYFNNLSFKKFGFTHSYYNIEKKDMNNFKNQVILLFKNKYLLDFIGKKAYDELYKHRLQNLEERVESYSKLIEPYISQIKLYGLISTFFSLIIGFLLNLIIQNFGIQPAKKVIINQIILGPIVYFIIFILFYFQISRINSKRIYKIKKLLVVIKKELTISIHHLISELFEKEFKGDEKKTIESLNNNKDEVNEKIKEKQEKRDELIKKIKEIKKNIQESKDKIDNNKLNKLQEELTSMKKDLDNREKQIKVLKKDLKTLKKL